MSKGKTRLAVLSVTGLLACALATGGVFAYLSDKDDSINVFTIGDVHIKAWEPGFPTVDEDGDNVPDECELLVRDDEINKDPRIKNTGKNDAIVFFRVTAPVEEIKIVEKGVKHDYEMKDLFWFKLKDDDRLTSHANNFDKNWIELKTLDNQFVDCAECNEEGKGYTYIFGYHVRLKPSEVTTTLFDKVQLKAFGSRTIGADEVEQIRIDSFAVQADDIYQGGVPMGTEGELSEGVLTYIYQTYVNQNKEVEQVKTEHITGGNE